PIDEAVDSTRTRDQQRTVIVLRHRPAGDVTRQLVEDARCRFQSRDTTIRRGPDGPAAGLEQIERRNTHVVALETTPIDAARTHPEARFLACVREPDDTVAVLEERANALSRHLVILRQRASVPRRETTVGPDPQRAIASAEQAHDAVGRQRRPTERLPTDGSDAIETKQAEAGANPQVAVRCLRDRLDLTPREAVAYFPGGVGVLI